jgi:hypothetical protein
MKWKSILSAVVEGMVMSNPVAYIYYIEYKRTAEREAELQSEPHAGEMLSRASTGYSLRRREETLA